MDDSTRTASPGDLDGEGLGSGSHLTILFFSSGDRGLDEPSIPRIFRLKTGATVGRSHESTLPLNCSVASRVHLCVELVGGIPVLRDLSSKNGTFLNGQRIQEAALSENDIVRAGSWVGVVTTLSGPEHAAEFGFVSESVFGGPETRRLFEQIERVAETDLRIVLIGETGTGKEVFAKELHRLSRRPGSFVAVNCAAIPEQLAEGELFGYRKGAFSGADRANPGHFRAARDGTLFLDEVLDMPPALQPKLLRALEDRRVVPLGQSHSEAADPRVICAGQAPLLEAVEAGRFRADLYARLAAAEIQIAPLRRRRGEVWPFLRAILERKTSVAPTIETRALEQLLLYDWPLNTRELVQLAERLIAFHGPLRHIQHRHLPDRIAGFVRGSPLAPERTGSGASVTPPSANVAEQVNSPRRGDLARRLIEALDSTEGNVSAAAERVGISRPRAYRLLRRLPGVSPNDFRFSVNASAPPEESTNIEPQSES